MDMDSNLCKYRGYKPEETSQSLMHKSYLFSENEEEQIVSQFTYKGETSRSAKEWTLREHSSMPLKDYPWIYP